MPTDENRLSTLADLDEGTLEPLVKLLLIAGALFVMWALLSNLPGVDAVIPTTPVSYGAVIGGVLTVAIVAVLAYVAVRVEPLLKQVLGGPADLVADAASIAKHLLLFVAVLTAHSGLGGLVVPSLSAVDLVWTYDALFLVLALVPTAVVGVRLFGNVDAFATLLVDRVGSAEDGDAGSPSSEG
jgi:hypothetical protein